MEIQIAVWLIAFFLGAIPFSVIVGKVFFKKDIRRSGSGNPGATNMLRTLGPKAGIAVLLLDIGKGCLGVALAFFQGGSMEVGIFQSMAVAGLLAILGHIYSPFLHFKGGKGVATTVGVILILTPQLGLVTMAVFAIIVALSKYVSLASILAAFAYTLAVLFIFYNDEALVVFAIVVTLLIIFKHRANIQRLVAGEENKLQLGKKTVENN